MFLFSPFVSLFLPHRRPRGSLISFLFVRVAFNKLSLTPSLVSLVQQPLCLAPVNSPAFDNRPRRAYASFTATLFLLSSCPLILLLLLHPFAFTRAAFLSSNLHFFFSETFVSPLLRARRRSAYTEECGNERRSFGPHTENPKRGAGERMRVK